MFSIFPSIRRTILLLLLIPVVFSCDKINLSCIKREPKVQPVWFDQSLSKEGAINRALSLFPPTTTAYFIFDPKSLIGEKEFEPLLKGLAAKILKTESPSEKTRIDLETLFKLQLDRLLVGLIKKDQAVSLVALAIGNFNPEQMVQTLKQAAANENKKLAQRKKKGTPIYFLADDPTWGIIIASNELIIMGNQNQLEPIAAKYINRSPPSMLTAPSESETSHFPLLAKVRLSEGEMELPLREIQAVMQKKEEWEIEVSLKTQNEEIASTLKEYLIANQIMGAQMDDRKKEVLQFFLKALVNQDQSEVTLTWKLRDVPWKALMKAVPTSLTAEDESQIQFPLAPSH